MKRSTLGRCALVVFGCLGLAGQVDADQQVQVEISGLPPGAIVEFALSAANLNKNASATATSTGSLETVFDFANLGKPQPDPQGDQIQVYIIECKQPQEIRRVVFVAEGGDVPQECNEQRADTEKGCNCRRGAFLLLPGTTRIQIDFQTGIVRDVSRTSNLTGGGPQRHWIVVGGGPEYSRNNDVKAGNPQTGFDGPDATITDSGWGGTFFVELFPIPWLGGGYTYQSLSAAELQEHFTAQANPGFTVDFNSKFEPKVNAFYGVAVFPPNGTVQVAIRAGANHFTSKEHAVQTASDEGQEVDRSVRDLTANGWGPLFGGEVRFWPTPYVGGAFRASFETLKHAKSGSSDRKIDDDYYKVAFMILVRF